MGKTFLITGYNFNGFHGSMMHICEVARELIKREFTVYLAVHKLTKEIKSYIDKNVGAKVFLFEKLPLDISYDYVLGYHDPIFTYLIAKGLKYRHLGIGSLSSILDVEVPNLLALEGAPLFVCSERWKELIQERFGISDNVHLFINSVGEEFYSVERFPSSLGRIAVVSNHVPEELYEAIRLLKRQTKLDIFGVGHIYKPISSEVLENYDLVITIGKTVQYSLAMGIPVYNYDHFGGCGYITAENVARAEKHNFSGLDCSRKISGKEIFMEILAGYDKALVDAPILRERAQEKYKLSKNLAEVLRIIDESEFEVRETPAFTIYKARCLHAAEELIAQRKLLKVLLPLIRLAQWFYFLMNKITLGRCFKLKVNNYKQILDSVM